MVKSLKNLLNSNLDNTFDGIATISPHNVIDKTSLKKLEKSALIADVISGLINEIHREPNEEKIGENECVAEVNDQ